MGSTLPKLHLATCNDDNKKNDNDKDIINIVLHFIQHKCFANHWGDYPNAINYCSHQQITLVLDELEVQSSRLKDLLNQETQPNYCCHAMLSQL